MLVQYLKLYICLFVATPTIWVRTIKFLSFTYNIIVCLCVCTFSCVCACACVYTCLWKPGVYSECLFSFSSHFLRQGHLLGTFSLERWVGLQTSFLPLPGSGITGSCSGAWLFKGVLGDLNSSHYAWTPNTLLTAFSLALLCVIRDWFKKFICMSVCLCVYVHPQCVWCPWRPILSLWDKQPPSWVLSFVP